MFPFTDHRSIVANTDWKKLWMEGQLVNRIDNNIDSSDSTLPEESEVGHEWLLNIEINSIKRMKIIHR